ncbi:MAG: hypothetical protein ACEQSE_02985 [Candidatus Aquirickettsiella gammari]
MQQLVHAFYFFGAQGLAGAQGPSDDFFFFFLPGAHGLPGAQGLSALSFFASGFVSDLETEATLADAFALVDADGLKAGVFVAGVAGFAVCAKIAGADAAMAVASISLANLSAN